MNGERWQRVKRILIAAGERDPEEREAFVREACAGEDDDVRCEVESLLAHHEREASFIEDYAANVAPAIFRVSEGADAFDRQRSGRRVGAYKILREIGRGGMGAVYLAERDDEEYRKQVAVKIIKRGMDTDSVVGRFRLERQILADLDHPYIARLLDGGTTDDDSPFLVMEYVEGVPVDRYCLQNNLTVNERLELFRKICAAVQFAHAHLVIHRDLKPSNILVSEEGTPKLLDFGVAKLLDPEANETQTAWRGFTPDYASPEQRGGASVTIASDIYSLGVLLYELLTGVRPQLNTGASEGQREPTGEPERPSRAVIRRATRKCESKIAPAKDTPTETDQANATRDTNITNDAGEKSSEKISRALRGDLDNIVLKCLREEPARRYGTVEQLAEDIRRHLEGLPVTAREDVFSYRAAKFIRRNRAGVVAACVVFLALVAGLAATLWQTRVAQIERARAEVQRERAERRFNDVRELANSFMFEFHDAIKDLEGATAARKLVVERALKYLDNLAQDSSDNPALQRELANAYMKVGAVQGEVYASNTGDSTSALRSYRRATEILESLLCARQRDTHGAGGNPA